MSEYKRVPKEIRDEILTAVASGERVVVVAEKYGVSEKTVYAWLKAQSENKSSSALEVGRLRRENEALKFLVGEYALQIKKQGKKTRSYSHA
jgi:transposase